MSTKGVGGGVVIMLIYRESMLGYLSIDNLLREANKDCEL